MRIPLNSLPSRDISLGLRQDLMALSVRYQPYTVTQNCTFRDNDEINSLQVDATAAAVTVTLPSPVGNRRRRVVKTDASASAVTLTAGGTILINSATTVVLSYQYEFVEVEPTGTGWLIVARGTLFPSANGIAFPATQVPSADANTLDDYEEGTWTPSLGGNTTYITQTGTYTKIGNLVFLRFRLTVDILGTGSTDTISGLPFVAAAGGGGTPGSWANLALAPVFLSFAPVATTTTLQMNGATAGAASSTRPFAIFGNGADVFGSVYYPT